MYSELISVATSTGGPHAARTSQVKLMRGVKRSALKLLETFVERCDDTSLIADQFVPAMLDPILGDYARGVPDARCSPLTCGRSQLGSSSSLCPLSASLLSVL